MTIDSRELGCIGPVKKVFEEAGIEVRVLPMVYSDYRMDITMDDGSTRLVVVERKRVGDFIGSTQPTVSDPATKLARQINGCLGLGADVVVLLIDGTWYATKTGITSGKVKLSHSSAGITSKLRTVHNHGVRVEWNPSEWYLPYHLLSLYRYEQSTEHTTLSLEPKSFSVPAKSDAKWLTLLGIRGLGPKTAQALHSYFGSVRAIANAPVDELKKVKGVGPETAKNIHFYLN